MDLDRAFQMIYKAIRNKAIKWNSFQSIGINEPYYDWYYAENETYVIKDRIFGHLTLIKARSPRMAMEIFNADVQGVFAHASDDWSIIDLQV